MYIRSTLTGILIIFATCTLADENRSKPQPHISTPPRGALNSSIPLVAAALERTTHQVTYDSGYRPIPYPNGDVPDQVGVCTDLIIRSYRAVGIDLQKEVHEDMLTHFQAYPGIWGLSKPDPNIDHRRVPNLQTFLSVKGLNYPFPRTRPNTVPGIL